MARARRKKADSEYYAWSEIYAGGESEIRETAGGRRRRVIINRNIIHTGDPVSQADLDCTDEEWENLIANGSVRNYPQPDGTDANTSPTTAFMASVTDDAGNIDPNKLMALAAKNPMPVIPVTNPPAEEDASLEEDQQPVGA